MTGFHKLNFEDPLDYIIALIFEVAVKPVKTAAKFIVLENFLCSS